MHLKRLRAWALKLDLQGQNPSPATNYVALDQLVNLTVFLHLDSIIIILLIVSEWYAEDSIDKACQSQNTTPGTMFNKDLLLL